MTRFLAHPAGYGTHVTDTSAKKSPKMTHAASPVISLPQSNHFLPKAEETLKPSLSLLVPAATRSLRRGTAQRAGIGFPTPRCGIPGRTQDGDFVSGAG